MAGKRKAATEEEGGHNDFTPPEKRRWGRPSNIPATRTLPSKTNEQDLQERPRSPTTSPLYINNHYSPTPTSTPSTSIASSTRTRIQRQNQSSPTRAFSPALPIRTRAHHQDSWTLIHRTRHGSHPIAVPAARGAELAQEFAGDGFSFVFGGGGRSSGDVGGVGGFPGLGKMFERVDALRVEVRDGINSVLGIPLVGEEEDAGESEGEGEG